MKMIIVEFYSMKSRHKFFSISFKNIKFLFFSFSFFFFVHVCVGYISNIKVNNIMNTKQDGPRWGPGPPRVQFLISLVNLSKIATIQPKSLTKTIKIFTMVIIF